MVDSSAPVRRCITLPVVTVGRTVAPAGERPGTTFFGTDFVTIFTKSVSTAVFASSGRRFGIHASRPSTPDRSPMDAILPVLLFVAIGAVEWLTMARIVRGTLDAGGGVYFMDRLEHPRRQGLPLLVRDADLESLDTASGNAGFGGIVRHVAGHIGFGRTVAGAQGDAEAPAEPPAGIVYPPAFSFSVLVDVLELSV